MQRHDTLLIACGSRESRRHLRTVLQARYNLLEATNSRQMLLLLEQNMDCIAAVILDISNQDVIDQQLPSDQAAINLLTQLPVIVVAEEEAYQDLTLYFHYGAADVIPLNYDPYAMLHRIETITQLSLHRRHLELILAEQQQSLRHFSDSMVDALSAIIEYRSLESGLHTLRIRNFTRILIEAVMRHCPEYGLTEQQLTMISSASVLHDIGKIGIPDAILTKPGKLTDEEWETMKTHSLLGCEMLQRLNSTIDQDYLRYAYNICRYHHERWDGQGYPDGLSGDDIPICAQVVGLADCYDALTSKRVYKDTHSCTRAMNMILSGECGAFSKKLLECFKSVSEQFIQLSKQYADGRNPEDAIADMSLPAVSDQESTENLLEKTWAKYYCLVHYLDAFLVEVQMDTDLFQVIYNPFPELAQVQNARTQQELADIVACQIVVPEERERMYQVLQEEIPRFIQQDLRRQSFYFHHRPYADEPGGPFEMTFLRIGGLNRRPSLAILCRKTGRPAPTEQRGQTLTNFTDCTYTCRNDSGFTLVRVGRDTRSLGGYTPEEVMELFDGRLLDMAFPEDRQAIRQEFDRQLKNGPVVQTEYRFPCKDGSVGWVVNKSRLVVSDDGSEYIHTFLTDITQSKAAYSQLSETLERYKIILAQTENVLFDLDIATSQLDFSDTWEQIFGYKPSTAKFSHQLKGETHVHPDDIPLLLDRITLMQRGSDYETVEIRIATVKGRYLWCRVRGTASRDANGVLTGILGVIINIDEEKKAQQELEDKVDRDALTQLLNKEAGKRQVEKYLSARTQECALMILDLDNFKEVNDHYGHLFGDALLTRVSRILTNIFHSQDILARIGGDEFMVLVRGISDRQLLTSQCRRLRDMLAHAFQSESLDLNLGCSIGVALCPEHGTDYYELFTKADRALYQAKLQGKNDFSFYDTSINDNYLYPGRVATPIDSDSVNGIAQTDIAYQTFKILYQAEDVVSAVKQVMDMMGKSANVSRVYIFEDSSDGSHCVNTFEWCNEGITPEIQNLQYVSYETDIPGHRENFDENGLFYCHDVRDLPQAAYEVVEPQGIKSMLQCAIRQNGRFKGYIGFDECATPRLWTKEEIGVLSYYSEILSMFLLKYREQERVRTQAEELRTILENQDQRIYILDPNTYELKYINRKAQQESVNATTGQLCYQAFFERNTPCPGCPVAAARDQKSAWAVMEDAQHHNDIFAEATTVTWMNEPCCMMTCRKLTGVNAQALRSDN